MVYDITGENLKWAYLKLKNYIYYYHSSSYLKNKIIEFEDNFIIDDPKDYFDALAIELNELCKSNFNILSGETISIFAYPKKNQVFAKEEKISIGDVNFFIDMDIKFYLIDILYSLSFYDLIDNVNSFGNIFDNRMKNDILKNRLLLNNHTLSYKNWKKNVFKKIKTENTDGLSLVKIDMERCFYNIVFDVNILNEKYFKSSSNKPVIKIMRHIYRLYTSKLNNIINGVDVKTNNVKLPIGLFSSFNICNLLLQDFDNHMSEQFTGYSRYVDDILILSSNKDTANDVLEKCFLKKSVEGEVKYFFKKEYFGLEHLHVNSKKTKVLRIRKNTSSKDVNKTLNELLSWYNDEIEETNLNADFDTIDQYSTIKNKILRYIKNFENDCLIEYIGNLSDGELINMFPLWKDIFGSDSSVQERVENVIKNLDLNVNSFYVSSKSKDIINHIKRTLYDEISYINSKERCFNLSQDDIIDHVTSIYCGNEVKYELFPINVNMRFISFILSLSTISNTFMGDLSSLYKKVNYFDYDSSVEVDIETKTVGEHIEIKFHSKNELYHKDLYDGNNDKFSKIKVAVASLSIEEGHIYSHLMKGLFPSTYSMNDIFKIIKNASRTNCDIIIFPEISIPFSNAFDIINLSKSYNISIICGLTHYINNNCVKNLTLINDSKLKISIVKEKNYFVPKEEYELINSFLKPIKPLNPYYIVINNSLYTYSTMTCFEATSIKDRAFLTDRIEMLFMPVLNADTNYFSNIIGSFSRDASCFIAQANVSIYGDSRITAPYKSIEMDLVKLKGGVNNYFVVGEVDFSDLTKIYNKDKKVKILSAGNDRENKRVRNKIR